MKQCLNFSGVERIIDSLSKSFDSLEAHLYAENKVKLAKRDYIKYHLGYRPDYRKLVQHYARG